MLNLAQFYREMPMNSYEGVGRADWMAFAWFALVAVIVTAGIILVFRYSNKHIENSKQKTALEIAQERYAKGEISKEEYETIKKELLSK